MNHTIRWLLLLGLTLVSASSFAITGYVDDDEDSIIRSGFGECIHTQRWAEAIAIAECEPAIVAARDADNAAIVEFATVTKLKPVQLRADTLFGFDGAVLSDKGKLRLSGLVGELTAESLQEQKIKVTGYTDHLGAKAYNLELSRRRAAVVRDYLVLQGVVPTFIEMLGMGDANPVVKCAQLEGSKLVNCLAPNRRAEVEFSAMEAFQVKEAITAK